MNCIITFLQNNLDKLWTLVATMIGAFISYKATTASEKRKEKRAAQREKLKDVLIPLCSSVEAAMDAIDQYKTITFKGFDIKLQAPSDYLKAEKRVYLSEKQRTGLKDYDSAVHSFYKVWQEEQKAVFIKYKHWLAEQMRDCPDAPSAMDVSLSLRISEGDLSIPILEKKAESYKNYVTGITYIINDEPENFRDFSVSFNEDVKTMYGQIEYGISTIDDVVELETQIACKVYDYLMGVDDKPELEQLMAETKTNDNLFSLAAKAKSLRDSLLKDIDKIAG